MKAILKNSIKGANEDGSVTFHPTNLVADRETLGHLLRHARLQKGLSIRDLADQCGISKSTIVNVEGGKFSVQLDILLRIADALDKRIIIK